jgi:hypothetical protein
MASDDAIVDTMSGVISSVFETGRPHLAVTRGKTEAALSYGYGVARHMRLSEAAPFLGQEKEWPPAVTLQGMRELPADSTFQMSYG